MTCTRWAGLERGTAKAAATCAQCGGGSAGIRSQTDVQLYGPDGARVAEWCRGNGKVDLGRIACGIRGGASRVVAYGMRVATNYRLAGHMRCAASSVFRGSYLRQLPRRPTRRMQFTTLRRAAECGKRFVRVIRGEVSGGQFIRGMPARPTPVHGGHSGC